mmetsp:Transcript_9886/g.17667  ORF Transcript_9886/g.17667 Transcript_9886/m.17667 type:complete len:84 (+) Transcript_9886:207-458(+)
MDATETGLFTHAKLCPLSNVCTFGNVFEAHGTRQRFGQTMFSDLDLVMLGSIDTPGDGDYAKTVTGIDLATIVWVRPGHCAWQ